MDKMREILQRELDKRGWSPYEFEKYSGVPQPTTHRFLKGGHSEPKSDTVKKWAIGLGMTEAQLRGLEPVSGSIGGSNAGYKINMADAEQLGGFALWDGDTPLDADEVQIPLFREVQLSAGNGRCEVAENHGYKLRFAKSTLKKQGVSQENAACAVVTGNSMEPVMPSGTTVGIDTGSTGIIDGKKYAIDHDGNLRIKLLYRVPGGGLRIKSYNSDEWPDEIYNAEEAQKIRVIGRVFWWGVLD